MASSLLHQRVVEVIKYLEDHAHDTNVLLLAPPLNKVAYRARQKLEGALKEVEAAEAARRKEVLDMLTVNGRCPTEEELRQNNL